MAIFIEGGLLTHVMEAHYCGCIYRGLFHIFRGLAMPSWPTSMLVTHSSTLSVSDMNIRVLGGSLYVCLLCVKSV